MRNGDIPTRQKGKTLGQILANASVKSRLALPTIIRPHRGEVYTIVYILFIPGLTDTRNPAFTTGALLAEAKAMASWGLNLFRGSALRRFAALFPD